MYVAGGVHAVHLKSTATIRTTPGAIEHIRRLIKEKYKTHEEVSEQLVPGLKGFSSASVREENIH